LDIGDRIIAVPNPIIEPLNPDIGLFLLDSILYSNFSYYLRLIHPVITVFDPIISRYLFDISQYILLPLYSFVRLFVYSFDVIHTLGIYS